MEYYSQDITFCSNGRCTRKTCERHKSNVNWAAKPYHSFADFDGTQYCPKAKKSSEERGMKGRR